MRLKPVDENFEIKLHLILTATKLSKKYIQI